MVSKPHGAAQCSTSLKPGQSPCGPSWLQENLAGNSISSGAANALKWFSWAGHGGEALLPSLVPG